MQRADVERTCTDFSRWWDDALLHQVNAHVAMAVCGDWLPLQLCFSVLSRELLRNWIVLCNSCG